MRAVASLAKLDFFLFQSHHVFRYTNDIHTFFQLITVPLSTWMMPETPPLLFPLSMLVCYIGALKKEWEISRKKKIKSRPFLVQVQTMICNGSIRRNNPDSFSSCWRWHRGKHLFLEANWKTKGWTFFVYSSTAACILTYTFCGIFWNSVWIFT